MVYVYVVTKHYGTYTCTYHGTRVPWYVHVYKYSIISKTTYVRTIMFFFGTSMSQLSVHVYVRTFVVAMSAVDLAIEAVV
jgi:hypothetical protein